MASCSLRTPDFKIPMLDVGSGRVSTLPPCSLRNWIGRTSPRFSSLMISHSSRKSLRACCGGSPDTRTITSSETGSEEIEKPSTLTSQLIPNFHEVETLLTSICDTSSIAEFEMKIGGFYLRVVRDLKSENLPPVIQNTSSIQSDSNVEKATEEGLVIISSPKVGVFRLCPTVDGKLEPPSCRENQVVQEGEVLCYIDQFGAEIPIESDVSGEVVKILRKDGEPVGYGDALIAVLPSLPEINKLQ